MVEAEVRDELIPEIWYLRNKNQFSQGGHYSCGHGNQNLYCITSHILMGAQCGKFIESPFM